MRDASVIARLGKYGYGKNKIVTLGECVVPEEFQRKLRQRSWDTYIEALFGRIIIMIVDGVKIVVDGQHRRDHAMRYGKETGPAIVYENGTMEDAAALFDLFNSERVALKAADAFRAACVSGDRGMLALDAGLLARGLDGWCHERADYNLQSIGSVMKLYSQVDDIHGTGLEHSLYTLDVLADCWPWSVPGSPHVRCIRGFGQFLRPEKGVTLRTGRKAARRWNPADRELLTRWIAATYPSKVLGEWTNEGLNSFLAKAEQKVRGGGGGGGSLGMERVLAETLNKARRAAH